MSTKKELRVALTTLGCKVNQYETASFRTGFEERGVTLVPFSQPADIYIVNTCAVTAKAGAQSRQVIRRALRTNPKARLIVTGCYAQIASQKVLELTEQPICIVGNGFKHCLVDIALADRHCDLEMHMGDIGMLQKISLLPVKRFGDRTRATLKVQDGCNRFCSYCIVPYARGRSRSLDPQQVLEQARVFVEQGYKEIVLTGIHLGLYGHDFVPRMQLLDLVNLLLKEEHPVRYRLSSLESTEVSPHLLALMAASASITPHLHIPLQSGDNRILKNMNRHYTVSEFARTVEKCIEAMPDACIGVDVLVGFPGECEKAFLNTVKLLESLPVSYMHVFPYSGRPGTVAAGMPDQVANKAKEERVALLKELDHKKRIAFYAGNIGTVHEVLAEGSKNKLKMMRGFTENYIPVYFEAPKDTENRIARVKIDRIDDGNVFGRLE